jgi:hypothetical protein
MAKLTNEQYEEVAAVKVAATEEVLTAERAALGTGDDWRRFLDCQAKLYDYGADDVTLIFAQHAQAHEEGRVPEATPSYVAGFDTWRALGRHVERGQHGYTISAPVRSTDRGARDVEGSARVSLRGEVPSAEETTTTKPVLSGLRPETVFDASQTTGRELPDAPHPKLRAGEAPPGLEVAVLALLDERGWKVTTVPDAASLGGADSRTYYRGKSITIRDDMDDAARVKTLIEGTAHVLLHGGPPGRYLPPPQKVVEAESVAYVVASVHGMATDASTFPSVAGWAGEHADRAIRATQARISSAAQTIIAVSPAEHETGSKPVGTVLAVAAMRQVDQENTSHLAELRSRMAHASEEAVPVATYAGPEVA